VLLHHNKRPLLWAVIVPPVVGTAHITSSLRKDRIKTASVQQKSVFEVVHHPNNTQLHAGTALVTLRRWSAEVVFHGARLCIPAATSGKNAHGVGDICVERQSGTHTDAQPGGVRLRGVCRCVAGARRCGEGRRAALVLCVDKLLVSFNSFGRRLLSLLLRGEIKHNSAIVEAYDDYENLPVLVPYT
jgi:hypothetical protein